jgi:hypothetical protein
MKQWTAKTREVMNMFHLCKELLFHFHVEKFQIEELEERMHDLVMMRGEAAEIAAWRQHLSTKDRIRVDKRNYELGMRSSCTGGSLSVEFCMSAQDCGCWTPCPRLLQKKYCNQCAENLMCLTYQKLSTGLWIWKFGIHGANCLNFIGKHREIEGSSANCTKNGEVYCQRLQLPIFTRSAHSRVCTRRKPAKKIWPHG